MNRKVRCVVALQLIAFLPQLLAIPDAGFPSVLFLAIYIEVNVFPVLTLAVGPVIIRIYFRIQGKLCKQEVCDRACHTSVIVPLLVGSSYLCREISCLFCRKQTLMAVNDRKRLVRYNNYLEEVFPYII